MISRLGISKITGEYIIVHHIYNGQCSIELGDGNLSLANINDIQVLPIFKDIDTKKPMSDQDIKTVKERLDKINSL